MGLYNYILLKVAYHLVFKQYIYLEISASCQHRELKAALSQQAKDEGIDRCCRPSRGTWAVTGGLTHSANVEPSSVPGTGLPGLREGVVALILLFLHQVI